MVRVPVRGETLRWAMERMDLGEEDLARALRLGPQTVRAWLMGKDQPTYAQARKLAQKLHLGVPQLLLPPPEVRFPLPDFRRRNKGSPPSPELLEAVYDALTQNLHLSIPRKFTPEDPLKRAAGFLSNDG